MIKFENVEVVGWVPAIRSLYGYIDIPEGGNDSGICKGGDDGIGCDNCANQKEPCEHDYDWSWQLGKVDYSVMKNCVLHNLPNSIFFNFRQLIMVYVDITAPKAWWIVYNGDASDDCQKVIMSNASVQTKTIALSYDTLAKLYFYWRQEKGEEFVEFCDWVESLPYSDIITLSYKAERYPWILKGGEE